MPRCVQCDYDLSGLWKADGVEVTCPECAATWSEVIERSHTVWPGWRRYLIEVISIPGSIALAVLLLHAVGLIVRGPLGWIVDLAWALTLTPVLVAFVTALVLAAHYVRVPRVRRPNGWVLLGVGLLASACVQGVYLSLAVWIG